MPQKPKYRPVSLALRDWIDLEPTPRSARWSSDHDWPGGIGWLQLIGVGLLLAYPVVMFVAMAELQNSSAIFAPFVGSAAVLLAFICLGAGFRAAGGAVRGGLAGAALFLLFSIGFLGYFTTRVGPSPNFLATMYLSVNWPVFGGGLLIGRLGN